MAHGLRPVQFVRAKSTDPQQRSRITPDGMISRDKVEQDGREVRAFYESIIASSSSDSFDKKKDRKRTSHANLPRKKECYKPASSSKEKGRTKRKCDNDTKVIEKPSQRTLYELLRHCQEGNMFEVKRILNKEGAVLRDCDQYGWNALMCAAYSGHRNIVLYILKLGPSLLEQRNKKGQSALELAEIAGHGKVSRLLQEWRDNASSTGDEKRHASGQGTSGPTQPFWCEVCKAKFRDRKRVHDSSTAHLLSCGHAPNQTLYYLPESNRGFQMMLQDGWDKEKGLGKGGEGHKFPVKTVLKRDRQGLGAADDAESKPRITHFKPFDMGAVKRPRKKPGKAELSEENEKQRKLSKTSERKRHKEMEIDFRRSFDL